MDRRVSRPAMFVGIAVFAGIFIIGVVLTFVYYERVDPAPEPTPVLPPQATFGTYGQQIDPLRDAVPVNHLMRAPTEYIGEPVRVEGIISAVDHDEGTWITLDAGQGHHMRISFRDHGFIVPRDVRGRRAIVEGTVAGETLTPEDRLHMAEQARLAEDEIAAFAEPEVPITIIANGVLVHE